LRKLPNTRIFLALLTLLFALHSSYSQSRTEKIKAYIEKYKDLALEQTAMFRIPASVILAQAIKESDFGNSTLAKATNNHFGIKCHKEWGGDSYTFDDDTLNECFRTYASVEESFRDHSMFLVSRTRYAFLFNYKINDHFSWCVGLKNAGYATAWNYTDELLLIIKAFHLDELDKAEPMNNAICYGELLTQGEKNIVEVQENYFSSVEKSILAKVIFNQAPAEEEPLLVRRNDPEHAD
jgi:flagellum-specific peptidoglycan hydrolase FlgJ